MKIKTILAVFVFISLADMAFSINVKFTNLQCEEFDKPFATFAQCRLKAINRYKVALNLHVVLHQVPVNNISLNAQLLQKGNGYRPFMYNDTMDFCKFLKNPSRFMFWKIVWTNAIRPFSNINHTCPYDHDIIVDNVVLKSEMFQLIPFPPNEYMVRLKVGAYNHYKAEDTMYFKYEETFYGLPMESPDAQLTAAIVMGNLVDDSVEGMQQQTVQILFL